MLCRAADATLSVYTAGNKPKEDIKAGPTMSSFIRNIVQHAALHFTDNIIVPLHASLNFFFLAFSFTFIVCKVTQVRGNVHR